MFGQKKVETEDVYCPPDAIKINRASVNDMIRVTWPTEILGLVLDDRQATDLATKLLAISNLPIDEEFLKNLRAWVEKERLS